ncbi:MAG: hypothetical protein AAF960_15770 [Bacteroidota bacterium]
MQNIGILVVCLSIMSCNHHENMMKDSKYVFEKENFEDLSNEDKESLISLFGLITDSINAFVPLNLKDAYWTKIHGEKRERMNYKYMNDCTGFRLLSKDSVIISKGSQLRSKLVDMVSKVDSTNFNYIEVCNYGPSKKPRIYYRIKNEVVKGKYSYHLVRHAISNGDHSKPKYEIENIEEELIKLQEIVDGIVYEIGVSSEIGFFD